jgi:hypothetical protein
MTLARNATAVVPEVIAMARTARRQAYDILFFKSPLYKVMRALYRHASMNTKISSAAIPRTMKITRLCKVDMYEILKRP